MYPDHFEEREPEPAPEPRQSRQDSRDGGTEGEGSRAEPREPEGEGTQGAQPGDEDASGDQTPRQKLRFAGRDYDGIEGAEHAHKTLQGNFRAMQRQRDEAARAAWTHKERADALEKLLVEARGGSQGGPGVGTQGVGGPGAGTGAVAGAASSFKGGAGPGYDPMSDPSIPEHMKVHARRMEQERARRESEAGARPQSQPPAPDLQSLLDDPVLDGARNPTPDSIYDASKAFSEQFDWQTYHALKSNIGTEAAERYLEAEREQHWAARVKQLLAGPLREINQFRTTLRTTQLFEQAQESGQYPELMVPKQAHLIAQIWAQVSRAVDPRFAMSPAGVHYAVLLYRDYVRRHSGPESAPQPGNGRGTSSPGSPGGTPAAPSTTPTAGDEAEAVAAAVTDSLRPRGEALSGSGSVPQSRTPAPPQARSEAERKRAVREADLYIPGLGFGR